MLWDGASATSDMITQRRHCSWDQHWMHWKAEAVTSQSFEQVLILAINYIVRIINISYSLSKSEWDTNLFQMWLNLIQAFFSSGVSRPWHQLNVPISNLESLKTNQDISQPLFTILLLLFSRLQIKADREEHNNQKQRAALGFLSKAGRQNCLRWVCINNTGQTPPS